VAIPNRIGIADGRTDQHGYAARALFCLRIATPAMFLGPDETFDSTLTQARLSLSKGWRTSKRAGGHMTDKEPGKRIEALKLKKKQTATMKRRALKPKIIKRSMVAPGIAQTT
jgi:hypothetical protein